MFFENNTSAFSNLRHAVRPGGRLAATVWGLPPNNPWFSMPSKIIDELIADVPKPDPLGPGPMRFGNPSGLLDILRETGWSPSLQTIDVDLMPPGKPEQVAKLHMLVTAGMMLKGVDVTEGDLALVEAAIADACRGLELEGQIRFPAQIHVVTALAV